MGQAQHAADNLGDPRDQREDQGVANRIHDLVTRLREKGHRLTPQRLAVVEVLVRCSGHPSVEQIYDRVQPLFPMTSLATIYKTVALLKEMGEIQEIGLKEGGSRYDNRAEPHPHLVCLRCRTVVDLEETALGLLPDQVAQRSGYRIVRHRLDFFGICPRCQQVETAET